MVKAVHAFGARLKQWRETCGIKQAEAPSKYGVPASSYQKYELGLSAPGAEAIEAFVRAGINANWLLTGEGPMLLADLTPKPSVPRINVPALSAIIRGLIEAGAPADKVGPTAWRYYTDAIEQGLITTEGIGDGGKAAA